jgi:hypothetical protein
MNDLRGKLIVSIKIEIPVNEHQYALVKREKGTVTVADIVAAEEQNYLNNIDEYLTLVGDHITEVDFSFERIGNE